MELLRPEALAIRFVLRGQECLGHAAYVAASVPAGIDRTRFPAGIRRAIASDQSALHSV